MLKEKVIDICQRLHAKGWLAACDGNVSFRDDENCVWITPKGRAKCQLKLKDICLLNSDMASSEKAMHQTIYQQVEYANAVVHAHPPIATAFTLAWPELNQLPLNNLSEVILAVGSIPVVPYARPGTEQMGKHLEDFLPNHRVMILAHHGAISWGEDLEEAYLGIERLEHAAQVLYTANTWAASRSSLACLPSSEIDYLKQVRSQGNSRIL